MSEATAKYCSKHGEHQAWSIRRPYGNHIKPELRCRLCDREHYHAKKERAWYGLARSRARNKQKERRFQRDEYYRRSVAHRLGSQYGPDVQARYLEACAKAGRRSVTVRFVLVSVLHERYPNAARGWIDRVIALNRVSGLPLYNIGWNCARCMVESREPSFFDIDHIVPRSRLRMTGKRGSSNHQVSFGEGKSNLQLLCPNCHKCKTLGVSDWFEDTTAAA